MKDDDGLNCKASNLKLISVSQKQQRIFSRHRAESPFKRLTAIKRREIARKNQISLKLVVRQFNINGKLLRVFDSITEAAKQPEQISPVFHWWQVERCDLQMALCGDIKKGITKVN